MTVVLRVKRAANGSVGFKVERRAGQHFAPTKHAKLPLTYSASKPIDYLTLPCKALGLPLPTVEAVLVPGRRFRWDAAWYVEKVCVDVQGGVFVNGGHVRPLQYEADCEKLALTQLLGWTCLFMTPRQIKTGQGLRWIKEALNMAKPA